MSALTQRRRAVPRLAALLASLSLLEPRSVAAQMPRQARSGQSASARIQALHGAMPPSFDLYINDPCFGVWSIDDVTGPMTVTIMRYAGQPLVHIARQSGSEANAIVQRLAAHTLRFALGGAIYTMQCTASGAMVDRAAGGSHAQLAIRQTDPAPPAAAPEPFPGSIAGHGEGACDDPSVLLYIRQRQNQLYRQSSSPLTLSSVAGPSTLGQTDTETTCLAVAVFADGARLPITYSVTADGINWNIDTRAAAPRDNPLLGAWVGADGRCVGAGWVFNATSLIILPVPGDKREPKTFDNVSYNVIDDNTVDVLLAGHKDSRFIIHDDVFTNGGCTFVHR